MKRSQQLELMDLPISSQELLAGELKNLRRLNRWLGGYRGIERALTELVGQPRPKHLSLLDVGTCKNDEPCSRISWTENDFTFTLTMKSPPFDLIKIAESMLH